MNSQKSKNKSSPFFLFSFIPAVIYWYLESRYPLKIALLGGCALAIVELFLEKIFLKKVHKISLFNFFLILFLGGLSLLSDSGIMFKLQPTISGLIMGSVLFVLNIKNRSIMVEMMQEMSPNQSLPEPILKYIEKRLSLFLIVYAILMAFITFQFDTDTWLFFKTIGFYIASFIFFIFLFLMIRKKVSEE